ncbi:DUF2314 domain-containing protein [Jejuia spongiicola]|uniref:DUF2314 domain-containing protein n=1 Tax=Jejuia spongiicola TaxID=2942207 RepID=A0ABT0QHS0_9FLAO|nr:DUF2314 domain-containing protein [Jejuia spongiicola]MCL6296018.1 DUF2314 domain-containing protein [Jejuia spongiicola]
MKINYISLFLLALLTCASYSQNKIPKGNIADDKVLFEYAIYFLDNDIVKVEDAIKTIKKLHPSIKLLDSVSNPESIKESSVVITPITNVKEQFPPADLEYLQYTNQGLSESEKIELQKSKYVLLLDFMCKQDELITTLKTANNFVKDLVKNKKAVIFDSDTRETYSKDYWNAKRLINDNTVNISNHITIHFYQKEEYCRAITLGMLKFGLPDLCIENLSCNSSLGLTSFINLIAQTLLEKQKIEKTGRIKLNIDAIKNEELKAVLLSSLYENAEKKAEINLIKGTWEEGDPQNRLIEIGFSEANPQVEHNEVITKLFGSLDKVSYLNHNEELLAASKRAKEKIPELRKLFLAGLPINSSLLIKFPFENSEGEREWMWVEITKWKGETINGLLQNEPRVVENLKAGSKVSKNINDMFDYILYKADGTQEGNETSEIIMKMQN